MAPAGNGESGSEGASATQRLVDVIIDDDSLASPNPDIEHERRVAVYDLLEDNAFDVIGRRKGPYLLQLSIVDRKLVLDVRTEDRETCATVILSLSPFRKVVKDYFLVCESYFEAIRSAHPSRIEAIDMGRRGLHDEGSRLLMERLRDKIRMDFDTARRLFTLICALHWRG